MSFFPFTRQSTTPAHSYRSLVIVNVSFLKFTIVSTAIQKLVTMISTFALNNITYCQTYTLLNISILYLWKKFFLAKFYLEAGEKIIITGYSTPRPYFWRLSPFSPKIKQLWTKYPMHLIRNVPRNSKISFISVKTIVVKLR